MTHWAKRRHHSPRVGWEVEWCPDCQDRDALNAAGQARKRHGTYLTWSCENPICSNGRVLVKLGKYPMHHRSTAIPASSG